MTNFKYIIEGNWDIIKGKLLSQWGKLTEDDIDEINGSYKELAGKLKKIYGYKAAELKAEVEDFIETCNLDEVEDTASDKIAEIKAVILSSLEDYFQASKKKTIDIEKAIVDYATKNPIKTISIVAAAGLLINSLCHLTRRK